MGDDLLMLKNGQMLILKDHQMIALQKEMLLPDGTRTPALRAGASVALDGRVIMSDGTYQALVEGQSILVENPAILS